MLGMLALAARAPRAGLLRKRRGFNGRAELQVHALSSAQEIVQAAARPELERDHHRHVQLVERARSAEDAREGRRVVHGRRNPDLSKRA